MATDPNFKQMKGRVDAAGTTFTEDETSKVWTLYTSGYQARVPELADLTDYAGHAVNVSYEMRVDDSAYGCDLGTGGG